VATLGGLLKASTKLLEGRRGLRPSSERRNGAKEEKGDDRWREEEGRRGDRSRRDKAPESLGARAADEVARVSP
jgi:hypothetical protein